MNGDQGERAQRNAARAEEQWMDWALDEAAGAASAPDLTARVRAAIAAPRAPTAAPRLATWLRVACALLAVGSVVATAWFARAQTDSALRPAQEPQRPAPGQAQGQGQGQQAAPTGPARRIDAVVGGMPMGNAAADLPVPPPPAGWHRARTADEFAKVPDDCRALQFVPRDAASVQALQRLTQLERLDLSATIALPEQPPPLTDDVLAAVAQLANLRELRLCYRTEIAPAWLARLAALTRLETLELDHVPVDAVVLSTLGELPALRRLGLAFAPGVDDAGLAQCVIRHLVHAVRGDVREGLRSLSLRGCAGLSAGGLAILGRLPALEQLDLTAVSGARAQQVFVKARTVDSIVLPMFEPALLAEAMLKGSDGGVDDGVLGALAGCSKLRELRLGACGNVTAAGVQRIAKLPLRVLELYVRDGDCAPLLAALPPTLEELGLQWCRSLRDDDLRAIGKQVPQLRTLSLAQCDGFGDAGLRALLAAVPLQHLDLRACQGVSAASLDVLLHTPSLQSLDLTGLRWADATAEAKLKSLPNLRTLRSGMGGGNAAITR